MAVSPERVRWRRVKRLGAFHRDYGRAILWHTDRFDRSTARGWDRLYERVIAGVKERGGICLSAGELAEEAAAWLQ